MEQRKSGSRCIILGAGDFFGIPEGLSIEVESDYIIAADAGYENCKAAGLRPHLIVGDFDSMPIAGVDGTTGERSGFSIFSDAEKAEYIHYLKSTELDGVETRIIDPVKNDPDLLAAVRLGLEKGCEEFHFLGATGQRMDHSIANLQILGFLARRGCHGYLYGETQVITAICNETMQFPKEYRGYFSALSLSDEARGVSEEGFKYLIQDVTLNNVTPTGLSNEFIGEEARISVREGVLILVYGISSCGRR